MISNLMRQNMQKRKTPYSRLYKQHIFADGISMLIPIVNDLDDDMLQWHYQKAIDDEDYEYAGYVSAEAKRRNVKLGIN